MRRNKNAGTARSHVPVLLAETFRQRFAGFDFDVVGLSGSERDWMLVPITVRQIQEPVGHQPRFAIGADLTQPQRQFGYGPIRRDPDCCDGVP